MDAYIIPTLVISIVFNLFLTVIIASKGFKKLVNFLFLLLAVSVSAWILALLGYFSGLNLNFNWVIGTHVSALTIAISFYFLSSVFPRPIYKSKLAYIAPTILYGVIFYFLFFTTQIIGKTNGLTYEINSGYLFYQFAIMLFFFAGYYNLYKELQENKDAIERMQIKYILAGSISSSVLAMVTDLILPFINIYSLTWLGPIFTLVLVASISISIVRYKLFNIKVIATEAFVFLLWAFLLIRAIVSTNRPDQITNFILLIITVFVGLLLIRSVMKEVAQREEIEELATRLKSVNRIMSHDVKNVLGKNKDMFFMLLEGDFGQVDATGKKFLDQSYSDTRKLIVSVSQILESRDEIAINPEQFDLKEAVLEVVKDVKPDAEAKGLKLETQIDGRQSFSITADKSQILAHVLHNLIENAVNYTLKGSVNVALSKKDAETILLAIKDTGVGITDEDKANLFKEGGHGKDSIKVNVHSTGYGLFIAKKTVEAHKGKIWAESTGPGLGSTFFVELPVKTSVPATNQTFVVKK